MSGQEGANAEEMPGMTSGALTDSLTSGFRGFLDESAVVRSAERQEYLVCAALIPADDCDDVREKLRTLLLPGQIKVHWSDEHERRRIRIVAVIQELQPMNVVVSHLEVPRRKTERYRRKCLETLYYELTSMKVQDLTLESRTPAQDKSDRAHIVGLQGQGLERALRIQHQRGGDEPLLWIADAVLGAINASRVGNPRYLDDLSETLLVNELTPGSLVRLGESERP